jgi:hypothetical protein
MLTSRTEQVPNVQVALASARLVRYCQTKRLELQVPAPEPSVGDIQSLATLDRAMQTLL